MWHAGAGNAASYCRTRWTYCSRPRSGGQRNLSNPRCRASRGSKTRHASRSSADRAWTVQSSRSGGDFRHAMAHAVSTRSRISQRSSASGSRAVFSGGTRTSAASNARHAAAGRSAHRSTRAWTAGHPNSARASGVCRMESRCAASRETRVNADARDVNRP